MKYTAAILLTLLLPAALAAQQDTTQRHGARAQPRLGHADSTRHHAARSMHAGRYQTSNGSVALRRGSMGLSSDEVHQLQDALSSDGCNPGPTDGVLGPRTRQAMACARKKLGVSSSDPNALLRALNLNFSVGGNGMGGIERSGATRHGMTHDSTMMHPDTAAMSGSQMSHEMGGMHRDSTGRGMARDTGMHMGARRPRASIPRTPRPDSTKRP